MTRNNYRRNFGYTIAILSALIILAYGYFEARYILAGPQITISVPQNGSLVKDPFVTITGQAKNISYLSLNDRQIYVDQNGNFKEKLLLYPGYTIIKLKATDRFGRAIEKDSEVVYE